jgi:hypothetical protein
MMTGTRTIANSHMIPLGGRIVMCPGCGSSHYVMQNGNILGLGGREQMYSGNSWRPMTSTERGSAEVRTGLAAIRASNTARGWSL